MLRKEQSPKDSSVCLLIIRLGKLKKGAQNPNGTSEVNHIFKCRISYSPPIVCITKLKELVFLLNKDDLGAVA